MTPEEVPSATPEHVKRSARGPQSADRVLDLTAVLDELVSDGRITQGNAESLLAIPRRRDQIPLHPLALVADQRKTDAATPEVTLDLDRLSHWLADSADQPYFRIDPLKIQVERITEAFSFQFAQNHNILAVELTDERITICSAQPFSRSWEPMLEQTFRGRTIHRVVTNPEELRRYMAEFYTMARSVRGASDVHGGAGSSISNLEQMLEIGRLKSPEANDQHIVNIVDWLLQHAFDQRASDIEPRRETGRSAFASTACCTTSTASAGSPRRW